MATTARASRALLFMRHCRHLSPIQQTQRYSSTETTSSSPYAPSNFTRPAPFPVRSTPTEKSPRVDISTLPDDWLLPGARPVHAHPKSRPSSAPSEVPRTRLTFTSWALSLIGIASKVSSTYTPAPFRVTNNPYRARKVWPPDFRNLDPKQQFHFEKTYRRRAALKWARPGWNKGVKIVQQSLIVFTLIYFVFIAVPGDGQGTPFDGVS